mmetsp:Transcript_43226/g.109163  ORF Transcript_43226/g.109163 Transcript_43226/m.109163 type:complete len:98 (+) Transcript_43226:847-1140(+)
MRTRQVNAPQPAKIASEEADEVVRSWTVTHEVSGHLFEKFLEVDREEVEEQLCAAILMEVPAEAVLEEVHTAAVLEEVREVAVAAVGEDAAVDANMG